MNNIPLLLASTVVRLTQKGDAHGFLYLVDFNKGAYKEVYQLKKENINWKDRGGDRGFRGISFYHDKIIVPTGTDVVFFNRDFEIEEVIHNKYLIDCHETILSDDKLYILSSTYDSILEYDLIEKRFSKGITVRKKDLTRYKFNRLESIFEKKLPYMIYKWTYNFLHKFIKVKDLTVSVFDPNTDNGPDQNDTLHINSISINNGNICISGSYLPGIFELSDSFQTIRLLHKIPYHTHNAQIIDDKVVYNHTGVNKIVIDGKKRTAMKVKKYLQSEVINDPGDHKLAKVGFVRGLTKWHDYLFVGSSPATVSMYSLKSKKLIESIQLSNDTRNAIHGLEIFPFK